MIHPASILKEKKSKTYQQTYLSSGFCFSTILTNIYEKVYIYILKGMLRSRQFVTQSCYGLKNLITTVIE